MHAQLLYRNWILRNSFKLAAIASSALAIPIAPATAQDRFANSDSRSREAAAPSLGATWQGSSWLGGSGTSSQRQWLLGVEGNDTETGVVIRSVTPRSAADRARLEPGDTIVAVDGFQVGSVAGRIYSLPDELNRRADASGVVSLLVHDNRSGRLASLRVKMDGATQSTLTGTLVYAGRMSLPVDAVVTVQIENVSRPFYVVRNGQTSFRPTNQNTIPFQIAYDPSYIDPQDIYRIRAYVTSGGRTILEAQTPQNVLTLGNPSDVRMNLTPIAQNTLVSAGGPAVVSAGYPNYNAVDEQLAAMYVKYLGRSPSSAELAALHLTPGLTTRLQTMPLELMAAQEYFDLVGNNNLAWLDRVFREIVGKRPSQDELAQWMRRYGEVNFSRTELLRQLNMQVQRF